LRHPAELAIVHIQLKSIETDSSKTGSSNGAAGIIFVNGKLVHQLMFKLHEHCSNNHAEQIAIIGILEKLEELQDGQDNDKRVTIYTDSKITLYLLQNKFKWNHLIELNRNKIIALAHLKWIMHFGWVKGHAGIEGNELVDRHAKEAVVEDGPVVYDEMPKEVIITRQKENGLHMWQQQWTNMGEGAVTKAFFPSVRNRLRQKVPIFLDFTTMQQNPSSENNRSSVSQKIPQIFLTRMVYYCIHNSLPTVPILGQVNPVCSLPSHFLKIHFNSILPSTFQFLNIVARWMWMIKAMH